jgi:hypothetical protein
MRPSHRISRFLAIIWAPPVVPADTQQSGVQRGAYLAWAGGCADCHTNTTSPEMSAGRQLDTSYGTIGTQNIISLAIAGPAGIAWCSIVVDDTSLQPRQRLQRFGTAVCARLHGEQDDSRESHISLAKN